MNQGNRSGLLLYFILAYGFTWAFHLAIPALGWQFSLDPGSPSMIFGGLMYWHVHCACSPIPALSCARRKYPLGALA